jgi:PQ loop repeat
MLRRPHCYSRVTATACHARHRSLLQSTLDFMYVVGYIKASGICHWRHVQGLCHRASCFCVAQLSMSAGVDAMQVGITCAKYAPQVLLNFQRKSTDGFAILPVLCDITGSHHACSPDD